VAIDPGGDGCGSVFWGFAAGVDAVCDGVAQPSAEFDLFFDVAASPGRAGVAAGAPQLIGTVEGDDVDG
jgi:hypothetical protein